MFGGKPTVLVTNAGTGTEMVSALRCGLNVIGVDSARTMVHCAKQRLALTDNALKLRVDLAKSEFQDLEQLLSNVTKELPTAKLATPEKRRTINLSKDMMSPLYRLYHVVVNLKFAPIEKNGSLVKPLRPYILKAGLRLHIL